MYDLYTWVTPNGWKASIALEELGVPYTAHALDLSTNVQKEQPFLQVNPNGRIPALVDNSNDGFAVFESGAILLYLAEKHGKLISDDPRKRSTVIQWLMFQMGGLGPSQGQTHAFLQFMQESVPQAITRFQQETIRLYGVLDKQLDDREYIAGDYSIADIATFPWVYLAHWAEIDLKRFPALNRWKDRVGERPAVQRGLNMPHETAFWQTTLREKARLQQANEETQK